MHQELIRELAMITDEERRILEGKQEIDPQLYTEKKEMVVDSAKLLKKGKLIQVRPHTRFVHFPAHTHRSNLYVPGNNDTYRERQSGCARTG